MTVECCFCGAAVPNVLTMPFAKGADEYPKVYGHVCPKCLDDCRSGVRTEEEFKKAVGYGQ